MVKETVKKDNRHHGEVNKSGLENHSETSKSQSSSFWRSRIAQVLVIVAAIFIAFNTTSIRSSFQQEITKICNQTECSPTESVNRPTYWIYGTGGEGQWLHVNNVLKRLGFQRVTENESSTADLLWAHDYPFNKLRPKMIAMKPHQKVNHFPGCGFITNKVDLATTKLKYIPSAFKLPQDSAEFKTYAEKNPNKHFVVKHYQHRHIKIKKVSDINMNDNMTFIQEFIDNPLLVDGYKFDIGVYTIITSIDPLRLYIYNGDILFRYCAQKYHPFDPENVEKYIVGDDYLPTWQIPSLSSLYNEFGYGMKSSFDAYMKLKGKDPEIIWQQVTDAIREAILKKEPLMNEFVQRYKNKRSFFEMARFDLIVDANLKVYLMEANMSPNLSSAHFKQNFILYEQVIYNVLNLVGVGHYVQRDSFEKLDKESELMLSTFKNIMVDGEVCSNIPCLESCAPIQCQLCKPCLSHSDIWDLTLAYREHVNKGDTKRIFPISRGDLKKTSVEEKLFFENLSPKNQMMTKWFEAKCKVDSGWC